MTDIEKEAQESAKRTIPSDLPDTDVTAERKGYVKGYVTASSSWGAGVYYWFGVIPFWVVRRGREIHRVFVGPGSFRRAARYVNIKWDEQHN